MYKYKIIIEYDGSNFVGWQSQENGISVQKSIEESGTKGLEEERRLAYVALTRARKKIFITDN